MTNPKAGTTSFLVPPPLHRPLLPPLKFTAETDSYSQGGIQWNKVYWSATKILSMHLCKIILLALLFALAEGRWFTVTVNSVSVMSFHCEGETLSQRCQHDVRHPCSHSNCRWFNNRTRLPTLSQSVSEVTGRSTEKGINGNSWWRFIRGRVRLKGSF